MILKKIPSIFYKNENIENRDITYFHKKDSNESFKKKCIEFCLKLLKDNNIELPKIQYSEDGFISSRGLYYDKTIWIFDLGASDIVHEFCHYILSENKEEDNYGLGFDFKGCGSPTSNVNEEKCYEIEILTCILEHIILYNIIKPNLSKNNKDFIYICEIIYLQEFLSDNIFLEENFKENFKKIGKIIALE